MGSRKMASEDEVVGAADRIEALITRAEAGKGAVLTNLREAVRECQALIDTHDLPEADKVYFRDRRNYANSLISKRGGKP